MNFQKDNIQDYSNLDLEWDQEINQFLRTDSEQMIELFQSRQLIDQQLPQVQNTMLMNDICNASTDFLADQSHLNQADQPPLSFDQRDSGLLRPRLVLQEKRRRRSSKYAHIKTQQKPQFKEFEATFGENVKVEDMIGNNTLHKQTNQTDAFDQFLFESFFRVDSEKKKSVEEEKGKLEDMLIKDRQSINSNVIHVSEQQQNEYFSEELSHQQLTVDEPMNVLKRVSDTKLISKEKKKLTFKRFRRSKEDLGVLKNEFEKNPEWDREKIDHLAMKLNLTPYTIYKWNYDQKKKMLKKMQ